MNTRKPPKRTLLFCSSLLAGLALSVTAHAHGKTGKHARGCMTEKKAKFIAEFDADGDGKLSAQEREVAREHKRAQRLAQYDTNKDGELSRDERKVMWKDRMAEKFAQADTDGDTIISATEAADACGRLARHIEKADADGDGVVTRAEFEASAKRMKRGRRARKHRRNGGDNRPQNRE